MTGWLNLLKTASNYKLVFCSRCVLVIVSMAFFHYKLSKRLIIPTPWPWICWTIIAVVTGIVYLAIMFGGLHHHLQMDEGLSTTVFELDGTTRDNHGNIWDAADLLSVAVDESNAFFVTTRQEYINNQHISINPEKIEIEKAECGPSLPPCPRETYYRRGSGLTTGTCDNKTRRCNVEGWFPRTSTNITKVIDIENLGVLIKNRMYFPKARETRTKTFNEDSTPHCIWYNDKTDKFCPWFTLGTIVKESIDAEMNLTLADIVERGAVIAIRIFWDCDFSWFNHKFKKDPESCRPKYKFKRLDFNETDSGGFKLTTVIKYTDSDGKDRRDIIKARGILFKIQVDSQGWYLDWGEIGVTFATATTLALGVAHYMIGDILLRCFNAREKQYDEVTAEDRDEMDYWPKRGVSFCGRVWFRSKKKSCWDKISTDSERLPLVQSEMGAVNTEGGA